MSEQLHGALIAAAIAGAAAGIVLVGCLVAAVCGVVIDRHTEPFHGFSPDTERAVTEALRLGIPDDVDEQRLHVSVTAFEDELGRRRTAKASR
jgi:hypothetical protein